MMTLERYVRICDRPHQWHVEKQHRSYHASFCQAAKRCFFWPCGLVYLFPKRIRVDAFSQLTSISSGTPLWDPGLKGCLEQFGQVHWEVRQLRPFQDGTWEISEKWRFGAGTSMEIYHGQSFFVLFFAGRIMYNWWIFNDFQSPCLQEGKQQQHIFSCHLNTQKTLPKDLSSERLSAVVWRL